MECNAPEDEDEEGRFFFLPQYKLKIDENTGDIYPIKEPETPEEEAEQERL